MAEAYENPGLTMELLPVGKDPANPTYIMGSVDDRIEMLLVLRNEAVTAVVTERGFSHGEAYNALIVTDPGGTRHLLRYGDDAHKMPMPFYINDKPWGLAESIPVSWAKSTRINDLRDYLPMMRTTAGWYTIQAQLPFTRFAATGQDSGLGLLALLEHANNWSETIVSNALQVYIGPLEGAQISAKIVDAMVSPAAPLGQVPVKVYRNADYPEGSKVEELWSKTEPVLSGTTDVDGKVVWDSALPCLIRNDYTVVANYAGKYKEAKIIDMSLSAFAEYFGSTECYVSSGCLGDWDRDNDVDGSDVVAFLGVSGWGAECSGSVSTRVAFSIPAVPFVSIVGSAYNRPDDSHRASFTMDVSTTDGMTSGSLNYYFSHTRMNFASSAINEITVSGSPATIKGAGTVNGGAGYTFEVQIVDGNPDQFGILIRQSDGSDFFNATLRSIDGGNISLTAE